VYTTQLGVVLHYQGQEIYALEQGQNPGCQDVAQDARLLPRLSLYWHSKAASFISHNAAYTKYKKEMSFDGNRNA